MFIWREFIEQVLAYYCIHSIYTVRTYIYRENNNIKLVVNLGGDDQYKTINRTRETQIKVYGTSCATTEFRFKRWHRILLWKHFFFFQNSFLHLSVFVVQCVTIKIWLRFEIYVNFCKRFFFFSLFWFLLSGWNFVNGAQTLSSIPIHRLHSYSVLRLIVASQKHKQK